MPDLTTERLAELRRLLDETKRRLSSPRRAGKTYAMEALCNAAVNALPALLDAAAERDALAAAVERVRALHQPEVNSTSALFPTPLCGCGDAHPCATIRALDTTPDTGGES